MAGRQALRPKILEVVSLHKEHPYAVEARLIECGLRWDDAGKKRNTWSDILAVIHTEPPGGPIQRSQNPEDWMWYTPYYDHLQTLVELMATNTTLTGNQSGAKKSDMPKRAPRPWDEKDQDVKEIKGEVLTLDELDARLDARYL